MQPTIFHWKALGCQLVANSELSWNVFRRTPRPHFFQAQHSSTAWAKKITISRLNYYTIHLFGTEVCAEILLRVLQFTFKFKRNRVAWITNEWQSGQIRYSDCRDPKDPTLGERSSEEVLYLLPDTQRFLEISPVYLSDSDELEVRFDVRFNSARICWSRASPEEQVSVALWIHNGLKFWWLIRNLLYKVGRVLDFT